MHKVERAEIVANKKVKRDETIANHKVERDKIITSHEVERSEITVNHKVVRSEIITNCEIVPGVYNMKLLFSPGFPSPTPGQFVNVYLNDASRLLPRPISVCDWHDGVLTLVYAVVGAGTRQMSGYKPGERLRISTPLGKGFNIEEVKSYILVGGGVGVPPLHYLAKSLKHLPGRVVLGFRRDVFLADRFHASLKNATDDRIQTQIEIATDDGSTGFHGNVVDLLSRSALDPAATIFACGPRPMLRAVAEFAATHNLPAQVSLEERMGCGYGACVGCTCKTTRGNKKVCFDGPVFDAKEVVWDV